MPDRVECPRCRNRGFIRLENVVKAGLAERHYYCGGCDYSWTEAGSRMVNDNERPDRSRPGELPTAKGRKVPPERRRTPRPERRARR